ncbi:MAG: 50S ribosomal protein P1 [Candidatus Thorarchaeota archaeon]|jgi:large subunit ribosomal protein L12
MEYVYAALLLHKAGQKLTKALLAALKGVDIDEALSSAAAMPVAAAPAAAGGAAPAEEKKEEGKEEKEEEKEEEFTAGLGSLFG